METVLIIYDLPKLSADEARALIEQTLTRYPALREIYDDDFVASLARKRKKTNGLLLRLVRQDEFAHDIWYQLVRDLEILGDAGVIDSFRDKLRQTDADHFESARTELILAGFIRRLGYAIIFEPDVPGGGKSEFAAGTEPRHILGG